MIKIGINCHSCGKSISRTISSKDMPPRWARNLWKSALEEGWARREEDYTPFCSDCKAAIENPSTRLVPLDPMPFYTLIECENCGTQVTGNDVAIGESFAHDVRGEAKGLGWQYRSRDANKTYQDFCQDCWKGLEKEEREKLMRLVWSKSTTKVAAELGISDKAVQNHCGRLLVPKPPIGFWAKWQAGHMEACRALIPREVAEVLGEDFLDEVYPVAR